MTRCCGVGGAVAKFLRSLLTGFREECRLQTIKGLSGLVSGKYSRSKGRETTMMPIGPLMIEHRLIERMIDVMEGQLSVFEKEKKLDSEFLEMAVDFIRTYADRCHHGKEEGILFRELGIKKLKDEHGHIMEELVEEHRWARKMTTRLEEANKRYKQRDKDAISTGIECIRSLTQFYPKHIEKEDKHFFIPCMDYFSESEQQTILSEEWEFDKNLIHEKYRTVVITAEKELTSRTL
jgi:hemerythrin-like domain-containing protein